MKVRPRLLAGSLAVSLVASVGIGIAIARSGSSNGDTVRINTPGTYATPGIGTNAAVTGKVLPTVSVETLQGDKVSTKDLLGHPLVINIWGSTCEPCKQELPAFAKVQATYGDRVRFVGIDYLAPSAREEQFARDRGVQYELLYDADGNFISKVGISAFPVTLFVRADGTIVRQTGQLTEATLTQYLQGLL